MGEVPARSVAHMAETLPVPDGRSRLERHRRRTQAAVTHALGGPDYVTPQQTIAIRLLAQAGALREAIYARVAEGTAKPDSEAVAAFTSLAATETRVLKLLSMKAVEKQAGWKGVMARLAAESAAAESSASPAGVGASVPAGPRPAAADQGGGNAS